ncbi:MAG: ABC transporter ATP-binding protein [Bacillota bacterium]
MRLRCVKHTYPDRTVVDLCGLNLAAHAGERVAIVGPNGSGKTTLLLHVMGILKPMEGEVRVFGVDPHRCFHQIRSRLGVVLQDVEAQLVGATVLADVALGLRALGVARAAAAAQAQAVLEELSLSGLAQRVPHYLSGGEQRRVALAGALAPGPNLLLLDEPFAGVDPASRRVIVDCLDRRPGTTVIMTTHDVDLAAAIADRVYVIARGTILAEGPPASVLGWGEVLEQAALTPPVLVELFNRLRVGGMPIHPALNVADAAEALLRIYHKQDTYT